MYSRKGTLAVSLPGAPSLQHNNLSVKDELLTYVRLTEVVVSSYRNGETHKISLSSRSHVHQAAFVTVRNTPYLVVASSIGVQVWSCDGTILKYFLPLNSVIIGEDLERHYMDGITGFNSGWICVGSSTGLVAVISCPTADGERMSLLKTLNTETNASVTALGASGSLLACGNEFGSIHLFDQSSEFEAVMNFVGLGYSCTSLFAQGDVVVASFSSGHIRIFRGDVKEMAIEITAHTRVINALAVHPTLKLFLSCGDDQFVNAWSLPDFKSIGSSTTELLFSERIPNRLLTGVSFFPDEKVGVVAYDEDDLVMFSKHS